MKKFFDKMKKDNFLLIISLIKDVLNKKYSISKKDLAMLITTVVYVVSPIDAIPDFLIPIGYTDDVAVVAFVLKKLSDLIKNYKNKR